MVPSEENSVSPSMKRLESLNNLHEVQRQVQPTEYFSLCAVVHERVWWDRLGHCDVM